MGNLKVFPVTAALDVTEGLFAVITANMGPILTLLGITLGISFVVRRFGAAKKGKI